MGRLGNFGAIVGSFPARAPSLVVELRLVGQVEQEIGQPLEVSRAVDPGSASGASARCPATSRTWAPGRDRLARMATKNLPAPVGTAVERVIRLIRGHRVILDADIATFYSVETRVLVQAVKRNADRFPTDFMFQLTAQEFSNLRSQIVMSSSWGGRRHPPYAFTEHGVAMLAAVLKSPQAVEVSVAIVRAFVRLREILVSSRSLALRLDALERKYDRKFRAVFEAIRELMMPVSKPRRKIGFRHE